MPEKNRKYREYGSAPWLPWLLLLAVAASAAAAVGQGEESLTERAVGDFVERAVRKGEVQVFRVDLERDQVLALRLDWSAGPVDAILRTADGDKLQTAGSKFSRVGSATIEHLADEPASLRLELRTSSSTPAAYRLTLEARRAASPRDLSHRAVKRCREERWTDDQGEFLVKEALEAMAVCARAVGQRLESTFPEVRATLERALSAMDYLKGRWKWGEPVSDRYQQSVLEDFRALAVAAEATDESEAHDILRSVAEDLVVKKDHCSESERGLGEDLTVVVKTRIGDRDVHNLLVWYKKAIWATRPGHELRFPSPTNPEAKERLPAGQYLMWAGKPGQGPPPREQQEPVLVKSGMVVPFTLFVPEE